MMSTKTQIFGQFFVNYRVLLNYEGCNIFFVLIAKNAEILIIVPSS